MERGRETAALSRRRASDDVTNYRLRSRHVCEHVDRERDADPRSFAEIRRRIAGPSVKRGPRERSALLSRMERSIKEGGMGEEGAIVRNGIIKGKRGDREKENADE